MLDKVLWQGSLLLARLGGVLLVATALLVSAEVVLRKLGIAAFSVGSELSSYALAISATWAFALVLMERGHVRIDILTARLPAGPRAFVNVLAVASLAAVGAVLSYSAFDTFMTSLELGAISNTTLATPLWVPQGLWLAGLLWFTLVAAYRTVQPPIDPKALARVEAGDVDLVTFTSSSTVHHFRALFDDATYARIRDRIGAACIGPITADTAREHGLRVAVVADEYTIPGLVAALARHPDAARDAP